jgi:L-threonylcarbamoyladenylate synthase
LQTKVIKIDKDNIDLAKIREAANVIRKGGLVAFPTETVYGLGANALDETAVNKIFTAKGRPSDNPLIVHISDRKSLSAIVKSIPENALILMDKFWPGPLTIILKKSPGIPRIITAGLDSVAVRMPAHPIALALINESGLPVAAPSANISGRPSPTDASHVIEDLMGKVDIIIDGGSTSVGLESTVLDLTATPLTILRPGGVTKRRISDALGGTEIISVSKTSEDLSSVPKSPGMKYIHYSPKAKVIIIDGEISKIVEKINELIGEYSNKNLTTGVLATKQTKDLYNTSMVISLGDRTRPETIAGNLFHALREFDRRNVDIIFAESIDKTGIGTAIMNRLSNAAGHNIIIV